MSLSDFIVNSDQSLEKDDSIYVKNEDISLN